jgi:hypothetical protein
MVLGANVRKLFSSLMTKETNQVVHCKLIHCMSFQPSLIFVSKARSSLPLLRSRIGLAPGPNAAKLFTAVRYDFSK